jgi:NAD dependent epimerase/dehydratase
MAAWTGRSVLVTGACGFIGSHLTERLVAAGATVRAFAHYNALGQRGWLDRLPGDARRAIEVCAGDIRDADSLRPALAGVDTVFHLAALIAIPYSYVSPAGYVATNVGGTLNVLQAARDAGVRRVVHTSTSEVYGTAQYVPIDERHPLSAQSPYAASKIGADQLALSFHASFGLPVAIVRPFNTYGPRQSSRAVVPAIITQLLASTAGEVRIGALHPTRDLMYVTDTAEAFMAAALCDEAVGGVTNFGTGVEISIADLLERIGRLAGRPTIATVSAERVRPPASEVERLCADAGRARALMGWRPAIDLETGLARTIAWFREQQSSARADQYTL